MLAIAAALAAVVGLEMLIESGFRRGSSGKQAAGVASPGQPVPHESYPAGLKHLERWDKA